MEVFISQSGERSGAVAKTLCDWLPRVINSLEPWVSFDDIEKGARWAGEIASMLSTAGAGIICLTKGNLHSDWILFEAGALSKFVEKTYVCPLLIDFDSGDFTGPLSHFQATTATEKDCLKLVKTLNKALGEKALANDIVEDAFQHVLAKA